MLRSILPALAAVMLAPHPAAAAPPSCREACYQTKSQAYLRCRSIPPADRAGRTACFQRADAALSACLRGCR